MKRFFALLCAIITLCSCSKKADVNKFDDISLARVYLNEKLKIGLETPFPPLAVLENTEYVGFDIDVLDEVCAVLDVEPEYIEINWEEKDELLATGQIDVLASGFSKTPERIGQYEMTDPILQNLQCIVVRGDEQRFEKLEDLENCKISCQYGSTAEDILMEKIQDGLNINLESVPNIFTAFNALNAGKIDAVVGDFIVVEYTLQRSSDLDIKILNVALQNEYYVYAFRKNDKALVNAVNETLYQIAEDGLLAQIAKKWFKSDVSLIR